MSRTTKPIPTHPTPEEMGVKYPHITVQLVGTDGNAFAVMGAIGKALKRAKCTQEQVDEFYTEARSGDYDHLLQTCMKYVNVE